MFLDAPPPPFPGFPQVMKIYLAGKKKEKVYIQNVEN
jgi:hypothetical protein